MLSSSLSAASLDIAEKIIPARKRDLSFYTILLFLVGPLWSVIPLAWIFVIYSLHTGRIWTYAWSGRVWFAIALCEVLFSVHHFNLTRHISGSSSYGSGNFAEIYQAFTRVIKAGLANFSEDGVNEDNLEFDRPGSSEEDLAKLQKFDTRAIDFRNYIRTWFQKAPWSHIHTQELHAWLHWSIFNTPLPPAESLPLTHRKVLDEVVTLIEKRAGCTIPQGTNPKVKPILLTLDKINVIWRPFCWYAMVLSINWIQKRWLEYRWDARLELYNGLEYMIRIPPMWDISSGPRPIVFLHGLGLGLTQYRTFLSQLLHRFPDRPILVPLQPHISQDIFHPRFLKPMRRSEMTECLSDLLSDLGWADKYLKGSAEGFRSFRGKGVVMLSHSNGTYTHAWMLKAYPHMVARSCFVDPVTFCCWEGDVCYNFLYRPCATGVELVMRYFVGTELGVANLLQRHFDWSSNSLWFEEIPHGSDPSRTLYILSGRDAIVDAERVRRYLWSHGVRKGLIFDPNGRHGQALVAGGPGHDALMDWLKPDNYGID